MTWNYRVLAYEIEGEVLFTIQTVYYKNKKPISHSDISCIVLGESLDEVKVTLKQMEEATKKPILWANDKFPKKYIIRNNDKNNA